MPTTVRHAVPDDAPAIGRLLDAFNREFDEPTPGPDAVAERVGELVAAGRVTVLLAGDDDAVGLAALRFRPSLWSRTLECELAELYVAPDRRGHGLGRALLEAVIATARDHGASTVELGTSEDDTAARALYESLGFTNRERPPDGPVMYVYELEL